MTAPDAHEVTRLLAALREGDADAGDRLAQVVYGELHILAVHALRREAEGHTLQPTELVDEAFMRLAGPARCGLEEPGSFLRHRIPGDPANPAGPCPPPIRSQTGPRDSGDPGRIGRAEPGVLDRPDRAGPGARKAWRAGSSPGPGGGAPLLWRIGNRGDGRCARHLRRHGQTGLAVRQGVPSTGVGTGRIRRDAPPAGISFAYETDE